MPPTSDQPADESLLHVCLGEFARRVSAGESVRPEDYRKRLGEMHPEFCELLEMEGMLERALEPEAQPLDLPTVRPMRYSQFRPVGVGGMGIVYWAIDNTLNREVALKVVKPGGDGPSGPAPSDPLDVPSPPEGTKEGRDFRTLRRRFLQEAWVTSGMTHPGIAPVYELGETPQGIPYYTMRFIKGETTLGSAMDACREADIEQRLKLLEPFLKVCDTVRYAHARGVVHRDLKPKNIAIGEFGEVVVLDWGLARLDPKQDLSGSIWQDRVEEYRSSSDFKTVAAALGTPGYMAPEAAKGAIGAVDDRSDVYSLGVILFEILTGRLPFAFDSYREFFTQLMTKDAPRADEVHAAVPPDLAELCERALRRDKDDRLGSVRELAEEIRDWQSRSAAEGEAARLVDEARVLIEAAEGQQGLALLRQLDFAAAMVTEVLGKRPDHEDAVVLQERIATMRERGIHERERATRRRWLRVGGLAAVVVAAMLGVFVSRWQAQRTLAEEREWSSLRARAQAARWSGKVGQRVESLAALERAARIRPDVSLRDEVLACLPLCDLRQLAAWPEEKGGKVTVDREFRRCAWVAHSGHVQVRQLATGRPVAQLETGGGEQLVTVRFHPDGRYLALKYDEVGVLNVWDVDARRIRFTSEASYYGDAMAWHPRGDRFALGQADGTISIVSFPEGVTLEQLRVGFAPHRLKFSPDGTLLALSTLKERELLVLRGASEAYMRIKTVAKPDWVAWHPNGRSLATVDRFSPHNEIHIYGLDRAEGHGPIRVLRGHTHTPSEVAYTADGRYLLSTGWDGTLRVWDPEAGELRLTHPRYGTCLHVSDGSRLAVASRTHVEVWDLLRPAAFHRLPAKRTPTGAIAFAPDGRWLAVVEGGSVHLWDVVVPRWLGAVHDVEQVLRNPLFVGSHMVVPGRRAIHWHEITVVNQEVKLRSIEGPDLGVGDKAGGCAVSGDGKWAAVARWAEAVSTEGDYATVWSVEGPSDPIRFAHPRVTGASLNRDGTRLATGAFVGGEVRVWDVPARKLLRRIPTATFGRGLFGRRNRLLIVSDSVSLRSYDMETWQERARVDGPPHLRVPALHPTEDLVATVDPGGTIHLMRTETLETVARLETRDTAPAVDLRFSPDGRYLAVSRRANLGVELWDLRLVRERLRKMGLDWSTPEGRERH